MINAEEHIGLVHLVAKGYKSTLLDYEDIVGYGMLGLVKAAEEMATKKIEEEKQKEEVQIPMDLKPKAPEVSKEVNKDEPMFFVDVYVESDYERIQALSKYIQANGYKYEVHNKGKVK